MNPDIIDLFTDWADLAMKTGVPLGEILARAEYLGIAWDAPAAIPSSQTSEEAVAGALAMQDWLRTRPM